MLLEDASHLRRSYAVVTCHLCPTAVCLLLFAFCLLPSVSASSWTRQQSGTMAWLRAVYFLDHNHGWVAGSNGTLLKTTDGGTTWKKLLPLTKDTLHDVFFADEHNGWLVAERDLLKLASNDEPRSYLLRTEDGGVSWRRVVPKTNMNARLLRLVFADARRGWVFGETGTVLATTDGGVRWTAQSAPTRFLLLGGTLINDSRLSLVGAGATIIQTSDGGLTWRKDFVRNAANTRFTAATSPAITWAGQLVWRELFSRRLTAVDCGTSSGRPSTAICSTSSLLALWKDGPPVLKECYCIQLTVARTGWSSPVERRTVCSAFTSSMALMAGLSVLAARFLSMAVLALPS